MASLAATTVLLALVVSFAPAQSAQARSHRRDRILARALFKQAAKTFVQENYPAALQLFSESYQLVPKAVVLYNIAMCHRALFQYKESTEAFRKYLAKESRRIRPAKRQRIDRLILEMTAKLVRLRLEVRPAGAVIKIDGQIAGSSPFDGTLTVNPGRHVFEAIATGYKPARRVLSFTDGERYSLKLQLRRIVRYGFLVLSSPVRGATVHVAGRRPRLLPATLKLPEGKVSVRITAPDHRDRVLALRVRPETARQLSVELDPQTRPRARLGRRLVSRMSPRPARRTKGGASPLRTSAHHRVHPVPFYRRAWFWSVVGVVVVAAATAAGVAAWQITKDPEPDMSVTLR